MAEVDLQEKIDGFLSAAYKKFIVREYDSAIRDLKAAEVLDRENPEILYNLGVNYCRLGLDKTAIEYFKRLLKLEHSFIDALEVKKLLAFALIHLKNFKESEIYLNQVLQLVPGDITALNMKGYCRETQGKYGEALAIYESIIEEDNKNYNAYNSIAYILLKTGEDFNKSLRYARIAYESNRENPAYLDTLGCVYLKMGNYDSSSQYFNEAELRAPFSQDIKDHITELNKMKDSRR